MKNITLLLTLCFFSLVSLAFGQRGDNNNATGLKRLDRPTAMQAWSSATSLPRDTPSIVGGGIIVESEPNGIGKKAWLAVTQSGTYLLRGNTCNGDEVKLGELYWEINPSSSLVTVPIFDSNMLSNAMPYFPQMCSIDVLHFNSGSVKTASADVNPWATDANRLQFGEGVTADGRYYIVTSSLLPDDATVMVGRYLLAKEIQRSPFGSTVIFGQEWFPTGLTTLTVCSGSKCSTTTFERKAVAQPTFSGGKG
jgi:hypothetical protein